MTEQFKDFVLLLLDNKLQDSFSMKKDSTMEKDVLYHN